MNSKIKLIDIGINLTDERFQQDQKEVLIRAKNAGVEIMIITGTTLENSKQAQILCDKYHDHSIFPKLYYTVGVHPHNAITWDNDSSAIEMINLLSHNKAIALGECGLDFNRMRSPKCIQEKTFRCQLEIAIKVDKPIFLHERDAFEPFYQILLEYWPKLKKKKAVIHCFSGSTHSLTAYKNLGCHIGFTGILTYNLDLPIMCNSVPLSKLMIETDGPYLLPKNLPAKLKKSAKTRNESCHLPYILQAVHEAWTMLGEEISLENFANHIYETTTEFFEF